MKILENRYKKKILEIKNNNKKIKEKKKRMSTKWGAVAGTPFLIPRCSFARNRYS